MITDKKGLSTIVVTLILIVLSLVAVGAVWLVVNPLLKSGGENVNTGAECLNVNVAAVKANCSDATSNVCTVVLSRTGQGTDPIGGVKLIFTNDSAQATSSLFDIPGDIQPLVGATVTKDTMVPKTTFLGNFSKVQVTVYFKDQSGNQQICSQTNSFSFIS